jgi:hypothetical protein
MLRIYQPVEVESTKYNVVQDDSIDGLPMKIFC